MYMYVSRVGSSVQCLCTVLYVLDSWLTVYIKCTCNLHYVRDTMLFTCMCTLVVYMYIRGVVCVHVRVECYFWLHVQCTCTQYTVRACIYCVYMLPIRRHYEQGGFSTILVNTMDVEMSEILSNVIRKRRLQIQGS